MGSLLGLIAAGWLLSGGLIAWRRYAGALAAGVMGLGVSTYLGFQHHAAAGASVCNVSSVFNCDVVNRSAWSEIAGVPIAFLGSGFYAAVLAVAALALMKPAEHKCAGHLMVLGGALSLAYSAVLAWASWDMGVACLLCISLYGVNLLVFVAGLLAVRESGIGLGAGLLPGLLGKDDKSIGAMTTAGLLVLVASLFFYHRMGPATPGAEAEAKAAENPLDPAALRGLYSLPDGALELDGTEPLLGSPTARFLLVEFADFECPYCGLSFPEVHKLVEENADLRLMFKHYPISSICNDRVTGERHALACGAAAAADCARQQGRFFELSSLMFKNQKYLDRESLGFMGSQAGLDPAAFSTCLDDPRALDGVRADVAHAHKVGVQGTPAFFLKGVVGDDFVRVEGGPEQIALLLAAARQGVALLPAQPHAEH